MTVRHQMVVGVLLAACIGTATADETFIADPISGCHIIIEHKTTEHDVISWDGDCIDGRANGEGSLSWFADGGLQGRYRGNMALGRPHGHGVLYLLAEKGYNRFDADFISGELEGRLLYVGADGDRFEGTVSNDGALATGVFEDGNGEQYEGALKDGLYSGEGVLIPTEGGVLEANFVAGKAQGKGVYSADDGSVWQVNFVDGLLDGEVVVTYPDGRQEIQTWRMDKRIDDNSPAQEQAQ